MDQAAGIVLSHHIVPAAFVIYCLLKSMFDFNGIDFHDLEEFCHIMSDSWVDSSTISLYLQ